LEKILLAGIARVVGVSEPWLQSYVNEKYQMSVIHQRPQGLWEALPALYRQCAVAYSDFWSADDVVFPSQRHQRLE